MKPVEIGRVRVENVVEWYGPTRPTWVLPDASKEAVERHRDWLAPHFMDERGRFLMSIHSFFAAPTSGRIVTHGDAWRYRSPVS